MSGPARAARTQWMALLDRTAPGGVGQVVVRAADVNVVVTSTGAQARVNRWSELAPDHDLIAELFGQLIIDGGEIGISAVPRRPNLEFELAHLTD